MLFNSFVFIGLFLPITYCVFWLLRTAEQRYVWLAVTGYVFYGYWDPRFCLLMLFSTIVSYTAGRGFLRWQDPKRRKLCLVVPITVDLLLLGFFKYADFVLDTIRGSAHYLGLTTHLPHLGIILPIGISFYTFHTISYIVDSYRGVIRPTRNFFEFAAYVSLFSQLVAGPIVRFRQIEEDLENLGHADRTRWLSLGVSFFVTGLVEKVLIADTMAAFVDPMLAHHLDLSTIGAWLAVLGYTFQLYFDFSGYSTMAVGLGYMFGLRIPKNFNSPYKALDPSDFWRRWHISLSTCLRDYLYIPFGGNRHGTVKTYRNLMLTMLIGGLWHGANWTFVVWGAYHGLLLSVYRRFARWWDPLPAGLRQGTMFLAAVVGWVFFRSHTFSMALDLFHRMFIPTGGSAGAAPSLYLAAILGAGALALAGPNAFDLHHDFHWRARRAMALAAAFGACVSVMAGAGASPFLYFQF
ncbi:MAG TPA: MBOAT family protein [Gemmatimonadales bacterium]|nr:MBOAT family protein [Gemmatimonadales bacterium]